MFVWEGYANYRQPGIFPISPNRGKEHDSKYMNSAEKRINKEIAKTVARRSSQGWTADKIAARIWLCYGHLCSVRGNVLSVRMAGGVQNFVISQEVA